MRLHWHHEGKFPLDRLVEEIYRDQHAGEILGPAVPNAHEAA